MTNEKPIFHIKQLGFGVLALAVLLCTACGTKLVRGESPLVRMTEISHRDGNINLQVNIRNINGVDLDIQGIDLSLTFNESEDELLAYNGPVNIKIVANGTEPWSVDVKEGEAGRELLESLQKGDIQSLPYKLEGTITSKSDGNLGFEYEGHIYPLPGKPGHFR